MVSGGERERVTPSSSATIVLDRKHVHSPHFQAPSMVRNEGPLGRLEDLGVTRSVTSGAFMAGHKFGYFPVADPRFKLRGFQ